MANLLRSKRMPKIEKYLIKVPRKPKPLQTSAHQIAIARMWASLGYGKVVDGR